jgi:hypothetical protein
MNSKVTRALGGAIAAWLVAISIPTAIHAQSPARAERRPTLGIVLVDQLQVPGARAMVVRRKAMRPQNLILVTKETQSIDLVHAVDVLMSSRRAKGDALKADMAAPIAATTRRTSKSKDFDRATADLRRLTTAPARFVDGVGSHRVIFAPLSALKGSASK